MSKHYGDLSEVLEEAIDSDLLVVRAPTYDAAAFPSVASTVRIMTRSSGGLRSQ